MNIAIMVGSFNPTTLGHVDIIERSSKICSKLVVGIYFHPQKPSNLPKDLRLKMAKLALKHLENVSVFLFEGLAVDFAKKHSGDIFIRGVRDSNDYLYECDLAEMNKAISGIETLFLNTSPSYKYYRSTWVRDIAKNSPKKLKTFIPKKALSLYLEYLSSTEQ